MSKKILRFTASWCQPCRILSKNLEYLKTDIPIEVVDIDINEDLTQQYGIRSVPTLVLLEGEKEKSRLLGVKMVDEIENWLTSN